MALERYRKEGEGIRARERAKEKTQAKAHHFLRVFGDVYTHTVHWRAAPRRPAGSKWRPMVEESLARAAFIAGKYID